MVVKVNDIRCTAIKRFPELDFTNPPVEGEGDFECLKTLRFGEDHFGIEGFYHCLQFAWRIVYLLDLDRVGVVRLQRLQVL